MKSRTSTLRFRQVRASYLEVYEERVYDLLDVSNRDKPMEEWATVSLQADGEGNLLLKGLTTFDVDNEGEEENGDADELWLCPGWLSRAR